MVYKVFVSVVTLMLFASVCIAEDTKTQKRLEEMEQNIKVLQEKVNKMESTLMKGGGFMIVANVSCEIHTPFDGDYVATELSEAAAKTSVMEQCKQKVADKTQCLPQFVKCKK